MAILRTSFRASFLAALFSVSLLSQSEPPPAVSDRARDATWDAKAAAAYLDGRMEWWMGWSSSQRDHETFCISCHTALPYALAQPSLRTVLPVEDRLPRERRLLDNVTKRVRLWQEVQPFYPDSAKSPGKTAESRGTESILNALILAANEPSRTGQSAEGRLALDNMWAQQVKSGDTAGAWPWLQFHNAPWEGDSQYYGATLAALAVGMAPAGYRDTPAIQEGLGLLRQYLTKERESQTLIDRVILLWASVRLPALLTTAERQSIIKEVLGQQRDDGGFSLSTLVGQWKRKDKTPLDVRSDGYATGVVALALRQTGMRPETPPLRRSIEWLSRNQEKADGRWSAYSLNKQRELSSDAGLFMSDAATAYAVLALCPVD
jgi:squalene-hopene/tetraprenyl-beta-curcumene cyclase